LYLFRLVIGAGGNTFSTVRINMGRRRVATNQNDQRILSIFEITPIEIIQDNGLVDDFKVNLSLKTFQCSSSRWGFVSIYTRL